MQLNITELHQGLTIKRKKDGRRQTNKLVDDRISAPSPSHGNKGQPHNILHGSIESAIPGNPLVGPNISGLSAIQADL